MARDAAHRAGAASSAPTRARMRSRFLVAPRETRSGLTRNDSEGRQYVVHRRLAKAGKLGMTMLRRHESRRTSRRRRSSALQRQRDSGSRAGRPKGRPYENQGQRARRAGPFLRQGKQAPPLQNAIAPIATKGALAGAGFGGGQVG
jgi:hypothetical protein